MIFNSVLVLLSHSDKPCVSLILFGCRNIKLLSVMIQNFDWKPLYIKKTTSEKAGNLARNGSKLSNETVSNPQWTRFNLTSGVRKALRVCFWRHRFWSHRATSRSFRRSSCRTRPASRCSRAVRGHVLAANSATPGPGQPGGGRKQLTCSKGRSCTSVKRKFVVWEKVVVESFCSATEHWFISNLNQTLSWFYEIFVSRVKVF